MGLRALISIVLAVVLAGSAAASWVAPGRPLEPGESLAVTVGSSALVAVGRMIVSYDTTIANSPGTGTATFVVVTFEPTRVLFGHAPGRQFPFVLWLPDLSRSPGMRAGTRGRTQDLKGYSRRVLICFDDLSDWARAPAGTLLGAAQRTARWAASESRSPYSEARIRDWSAAYEREIRDEIARQAPRELARRSDRIVLVRTPAQFYGGASPWMVERTIKGTATRTVPVRPVVPSEFAPGSRALLFLRKVGAAYEPVRLGGGFVPVRGDRVPSWGCTLDDAIARISP